MKIKVGCFLMILSWLHLRDILEIDGDKEIYNITKNPNLGIFCYRNTLTNLIYFQLAATSVSVVLAVLVGEVLEFIVLRVERTTVCHLL